MRLKKLYISNIGPFKENQTLDFEQYSKDDQVLIIGDNQDAAGMDSNGAGKTWLLSSITWIKFGRTPKDLGVDEIIKEGKDQAEGTLIMDDNGKEITITRKRSREGKSELYWYVDGQDKTRRTPTQTQKALLEYFGIMEANREYFSDYLNTTYFGVDVVKAFASKDSTSKDRMDLISRYLKLSTLDRAGSKARNIVNNLKGELQTLEGKIEHLSEKIDSTMDPKEVRSNIDQSQKEIEHLNYELEKLDKKKDFAAYLDQLKTQIEDIDDNVDQINQAADNYIKILNERIEELSQSDQKRREIKQNIEKLEQELMNYDFESLKAKIEECEKKIQKGNKALNNNQSKESELQDQLDNAFECPECSTPLMLDSQSSALKPFDQKALEDQLEKTEANIEKIQKNLEKYRKRLKNRKEDLDKANKKSQAVKHYYEHLNSLKDTQPKIDKAKAEIEAKEKERSDKVKAYKKKRDQLSSKLEEQKDKIDLDAYDIKNEIENVKNKINKLNHSIAQNKYILEAHKKDSKKLKEYKVQKKESLKEIEQYEFWVKGFPKIRSWMIETFLPSFEEQTNEFLSKMEASIKVQFSTTKETKKGNKRDEFDFTIVDENNYKRSFESYSGGESKRIGVCTGFALRELTLNKGYNSFEFLMLDEVVDSLDETGIGEFFNLLVPIKGLKLIISHDNGLKQRFHNVVKVVKKDGESFIEQ